MSDPALLWPHLMRAAMRCNITPKEFWRLSVREWRLLNAAPRAEILSRSALDDLMTAFPDEAAHG